MKIVNESCSIDATHPGFIHLVHRRIKDTGQDIGGHLWFERASLPWVIDTLRACLVTYGFPKAETRLGDDCLTVFESGQEQAPVINLYNVRPSAATHGGVYARSLSRTAAERLVAELSAARDSG